MEPEVQSRVEELPPAGTHPEHAPVFGGNLHEGREHNTFDQIFIGPQGLRAGWSILLFYSMYYLFRIVVGTIFYTAGLVGGTVDNSASSWLIVELVPFISLVASAAIMALLEGRRIPELQPGRSARRIPFRLRCIGRLFGALIARCNACLGRLDAVRRGNHARRARPSIRCAVGLRLSCCGIG